MREKSLFVWRLLSHFSIDNLWRTCSSVVIPHRPPPDGGSGRSSTVIATQAFNIACHWCNANLPFLELPLNLNRTSWWEMCILIMQVGHVMFQNMTSWPSQVSPVCYKNVRYDMKKQVFTRQSSNHALRLADLTHPPSPAAACWMKTEQNNFPAATCGMKTKLSVVWSGSLSAMHFSD